MGHHPYFPKDLVLAGYEDPVIPVEIILGIFFSVSAVLLVASYLWTGGVKHFTASDRIMFCWLILTGVIHTVIEGAYVLDADFFKNTSKTNLLSELWKEYSKADSRYATRDPTVVSIEFFTSLFEGPGCFLIALGMVKLAPWRHVLAVLVSSGQFYGCCLYFSTCFMNGWESEHSRPEFLYFWFYFVVMNTIWLVAPFLVVVKAGSAINSAVGYTDRNRAKTKKR